MRSMGIDYGRRRIGVALSDPEGRIAFPHRVIENRGARQAADELQGIAVREDISEIVLGLPLGLEGLETEGSAEVRAFADKLKAAVRIPVHFENEMFTTRLAEAAGGRKELNDASAAALILQSYLDKLGR